MKRLIPILLMAVMALPMRGWAGEWINGLYYTLNSSNHTATVSQPGSWTGHEITHANIPASVSSNGVSYSVTAIGANAFYNCTGLTTVTIGANVTSVNGYAFKSCDHIATVNFNATNCTSMVREETTGSGLFSYTFYYSVFKESTSTLTTLNIGSGVTKIPDYAFEGCSAIALLSLPPSVTEIGESAFKNCRSISGVLNLPASVTSIGSNAFYGCSSISGNLNIPSSLTSIGSNAFEGCGSLTGVDIPSSVTSLGTYVFEGCTGLASASVNCQTIPYCLFGSCTGLTTVTIGANVTTVLGSAFKGCDHIATVNFNATNCTSMVREETTGSGLFSYTFYYSVFKESKSTLTTLNIGSGVTKIPDYAFEGCSAIAHLSLPPSVTEIGESAFKNCRSISGVLNLPASVTSIGSNAFYGCSSISGNLNIPSSLTSIGSNAFEGCGSLTGVDIPSSVTSLGTYVFEGCTGLVSASVNCQAIPYCLFGSCTGLTTVTIGANVTSVNGYAFKSCDHIATVNFNATNCTSMVREETTGSGLFSYTFYYSVFKESKSTLTTLNVGSGVTTIPDHAFADCSAIAQLSLPSSVTEIGESAFKNCRSISGVLNLPASVTSIGSNAFYGCSSISGNLNIPSSLTSIGSNAFEGCGSLTGVDIPSSVTSLGTYVFEGCTGLVSASVNCQTIPYCLFGSCTGLTTVTIGANVTTVLGSAFKGCDHIATVNFNATNCTSMVREETTGSGLFSYTFYYSVFKESTSTLTTLNIGSGVTTIPDNAFRGCANIESIHVARNTPPVVYENTFVYSQSTLLQVPEASFHLYRTHEYWSRFLMASNLIVAGVPVTEENASHITGTGISGSVSYSMESNILTLSNATINCTGKNAIVHWIDNFTINLIGTNTITVSGSNGLNLQGHTTIQGIGTLNVTSNQNAIVAGDDLDISGGCSVTATGGTGSDCCSVHGLDGHTLLVNNSTLEATQGGSTYGSVGGFSTVTMTDCMVIEPLGAVWNATHHRFENAQGNAITGNTVISYIRYDLWVSGTQVSDNNASDVLGDGTVSYDPDNYTLTLNGANIRTSNTFALKSDIDGLKIVLQGNNTLYASNVTAIYLSQQTTFQGTGRLDVTGLSAIETANGLVIQGGCAIIATATGFSNCAAIYTDASNTYSGRTSTLLINASTLNAHAPHSPLGCISGMASEPATQGSTVRIMPDDTAIEWDNTSHCYRYTPGGRIYNGRIIFYHSEYTLSVGGVQVNLANQDDVLGDGTVSYDPDRRTLTLNEAHITNTGSGNDGIQTSIDGLTINLIGDNTITSGDDGIQITSANTTFTGFGTLTVDGCGWGIYVYDPTGKTISFTNGCTVKLTGSSYGIDLEVATLNIENATLWAKGSTKSVSCGSLSMEGVEISAPAGATFNNGSIYANGTVVKGEYVKITPLPYDLWVAGTRVDGGNAPDVLGNGTVSYDANNNVLTLNGTSINVSSGQGIKNNIPNLTIVLVGSNTITSSGSGIYSDTDFTIDGRGSLNVTGSDGIWASGCNLTIQGGCTVTTTGNYDDDHAGIYGSSDKTLSIINSKVTAQKQDNNGYIAACPILYIHPVLTGCSLTSPTGAFWSDEYHYYVDSNDDYITAPIVISPTPYNLWIAGTQVTSANAFDVLNNGGKVIYDAEENVLTLNGATISNATDGIRTGINNLTIKLLGDNSISSSDDGIEILSGGTHTDIVGPGSLTTNSSYGIFCNSSNYTLTIKEDAKVFLNGSSTGIGMNNSNLVVDCAELWAKGNSAKSIACSTLTMMMTSITEPDGAVFSASAKGVVESNGSSTLVKGTYVKITPEAYNIWIADTQVTSANCENFTEGVESGRVHFDPDENCLYLNNATIHSNSLGEPVIRVVGLSYLTIDLTGDNYLLGSDSDGNQAIELYGSSENELNFEGPGSLNANTNIEFRSGNWDVYLNGCSVNLGNEGYIYSRANSSYNLNLQGSTLSAYEVSGIDRLDGGRVMQPEGAYVGAQQEGVILTNGQLAHNVVIGCDLNLWVAGTRVTSLNANNITGPGISGSVSYDCYSRTLTLNNATIVTDGKGIFNTMSDAWSHINLIGENTILSEGDDGIYTSQQIYIKGDGSLLTSGTYGIYTEEYIYLEGNCSVEAIGTDHDGAGIYCASTSNKTLNVGRNNTLRALTNAQSSKSSIAGFKNLSLINVDILQPLGGTYSQTYRRVNDANGNQYNGLVEIGYAEYDLWICYERVTSANASHIVGQQGNITGNVSYDRYTNTLTLNGATIGGQSDYGITNQIDGLTIRLIGNNTINSWDESLENDGANLTIKGTGTLTIEDSYSGIDAYNMNGKNLIIKDGCVVNIEHGVTYVDGGTLIVSNATLQSNGDGSNAVVADNLILDYVKISTPSNAVFNAETHRVEDANGNPVTGQFVIEPIKYDLWVAGTQVTAYNAANITGAGISGNVSYDAGNNVLTLNNANLICLEDPDPEIADPDGIRNEGVADLTIQLVGNNTIQAGDDGINMARHTTITGGGTLNVTAPCGIYDGTSSGTNVVIADGCCINVTSTNYGICSNGSITVQNAEIKTTGSEYGSLSCKQLTLEGCSITSPSGAVWNPSTHNVEVNGTVVKSQVVIEPIHYNLRIAGTQVTTANASNITGPGITGGMVSYDATSNTLTLRDAEITASAEAVENGIPNLGIVVEGVSNLSSANYGVRSYANFSIEGGGVLNIWSENNGIRADNSSLTISGGCTVHTYHVGSGLYPGVFIAYTLTVDGSTLIIDPISNIICPMSCGSYELVGTEFSQPVPAILGSDGRIYSNGNLYTGQIVIEPIKYELWVAGTQVTSVNAANVLGNGSVSYNASTQTLTLSNADIVYTYGEVNQANGIYNAGIDGLKIVLEGANSITAGDAGILTNVETEIMGIGTLNISAPWGIYGDWSDSKLTLSEGCMVQVEASTLGVDVVSLTVDKSTLVASGDSGSVRTDDLDLVGASIYLPVQAEWDEEGYGYVIENGVPVTSQVVISILQYDLWVAGTRVNAVNADNILGEGIISGLVSYDEVTNTLTLDNAYIFYEVEGNGHYFGGIITKCDNLTINLVGDNTIYTDSSDDSDNGILIYGTNTTFTGQGTLDIGSSQGIWCFHNNLDDTRTFNLTFSGGCDVEIYQSDCGIYLNDLGKLNVDHASVSVIWPTTCGIYLEQEPELVGTEILFPRGGYWNGHQIVDPNGSATQSVTINPCNVFLGTIDSSWDVEGNWSYDIVPDAYSKVHIAAPCVSDDNIQVREIVIDDSGSLNLVNDAVLTVDNIVNDDPAKFVITYGQLYCDNEVVGTFHKNITMAGSDATGWYTIAVPMIAVPMNSPSIANLTANTYDLYAYDEDADQNEWQNCKDNPFSLVSGHGYLYANSATTDLVMTGTFRPSNRMLTKLLSYGAQYEGIRGFNLVGNPFPHNITMSNVKVNGEPISEFYILNNSGELQLFNQGDDVILPGQGFFIKATMPNQKVTIEGE